MSELFGNLLNLQWQQVVMWAIGGLLIWLAVKKDMEPTLLLPIGFGAILVNIPMSGAVTHVVDGMAEVGILDTLFNFGIANELFPLLLFIGIGAMIDFGPLFMQPKMLFLGAAAQFGIFATLSLSALIGFELRDAAAIASIGTADGPVAIVIANYFNTQYLGTIVVVAYSYMALVPIVQPPIVKALTTQKERLIKMDYDHKNIPKSLRVMFPIVVTLVTGLVAPKAIALVGFLMFGNLIRECGVLNMISQTAQKELPNLITLVLGITVAVRMQAEYFLTLETFIILGLGLIAFALDTAGGIVMAKIFNLFGKTKINPMVGAAGISAFPMSARVIHKMGLKEDPNNFLLMPAISANVAGQISSVIAGGLIISLVML